MNCNELLENQLSLISEEISIRDREDAIGVLVSFLFKDGKMHHMLPDEKDKIIEDLKLYLDYNRFNVKSTNIKMQNEIVFHNKQAFGDILTMTAGIRDFKKQFPLVKVGVQTTSSHIWDNNPNIEISGNDIDHKKILKIGLKTATQRSTTIDSHMCNAFRTDIENRLNIKIEQGPIRPDIWFSKDEYNREPLINMPYWIIAYGGAPGWPAKQYHRWQEVINMLKGKIQFIQIGIKNQYPVLNNVIDFTGRTESFNTGIRDLMNLFFHAQGSLGLVSMQMHMAAAFQLPCVVIAGGREPAWFTQYYGHQYLQTNGTTDINKRCQQHKACWACLMEGCTNQIKGVPKCTSIIEPEEVVIAIEKYYKGGRLEYNKKKPNKLFKNIIENKIISIPKEKTKFDPENYGYTWGGSCITDKDWSFISDTIDKYKIKDILEFGAGLSTCLFEEKDLNVTSYEVDLKWIKHLNLKSKIVKWDGKNINNNNKYQMIFVDGPAGGQNREYSIEYASKHSDIIIIHDAGRPTEKKWQEKYLVKSFNFIKTGGHKCNLWMRKLKAKDITKPSMRMITTCRGFGGSERSSIQLMKIFNENGYNIQLVPTGNISREYSKNMPDFVEIKRFEDLTEYTDLTIFYTSDQIGSFNQEKYNIFNKLNTKRKIMVLNYYLGYAGKLEWTKNWDKYIFLNEMRESEFLERHKCNTAILGPPADITEFLKVNINYDGNLKLIRHSSQGDVKNPIYTDEFIDKIYHEDKNIEFYFMPPRSDSIDRKYVHKFKVNELPIPQYLSQGNCFFYHIPKEFQEQGPRVIIEAMACGLPVIADNLYGARDRVNKDTGWLCDTLDDYYKVIREILNNPDILKIKGENARKFAIENFTFKKWYDTIIL